MAMSSYVWLCVYMCECVAICGYQETIKGTERASPIYTLSIGNSSRVIFRIGIKLPRARRGCFA